MNYKSQIGLISSINKKLAGEVHIAPLAVFRIIFGAMMLGSVIRFLVKGWVYDLYVMPKFYFPYYGLEWIKPLGETGMYLLFALMGISAFCIMLGLFYRFASLSFFLAFTYVELIDKVNYLNHYYFISLVSFLLILVPAHRYFSLDVLRKPALGINRVPQWMIGIFKFQLGIVYFYAGLAKLNYDWLFRAMPLKTWLAANTDFPFIGGFFDQTWLAFAFSWVGAIYDLSIPFLLLMNKARNIAYLLVIVFHVMTAVLFPIGMFPYIMILATLIFFPGQFHVSLIEKIKKIFYNKLPLRSFIRKRESQALRIKVPAFARVIQIKGMFLMLFFTLQLLLPFRYLLYPGKLFWTEEGYRFSWRVMLMEKAGAAFFYVKNPSTGQQCEVMNDEYLTRQQEKMMSTQPDMILQFAHFLEKEYKKKGIKDPEVFVESYVALNGSGSRLYIDKKVDLTKEKESFSYKKWILPFNEDVELSQK